MNSIDCSSDICFILRKTYLPDVTSFLYKNLHVIVLCYSCNIQQHIHDLCVSYAEHAAKYKVIIWPIFGQNEKNLRITHA